jgi:G3E family GTPase
VLVLNKTDLVSPQQCDRLRALLAKLNPGAKVWAAQAPWGEQGAGRGRASVPPARSLPPPPHHPSTPPPPQVVATSHGRVAASEVLNTARFDLDALQAAPGWLRELNAFEAHLREGHGHGRNHGGSDHSGSERASSGGGASTSGRSHGHADHAHAGHGHGHGHRSEADEYGISSFVYYARRPFHPGRLLADALSQQWGGVLRSKGFFWVATRHDVMGLWQSAGGAWQGEPR